MFNATFNNISAISWRSVLLVQEIGVPGENHWATASHWQTLSHNVVSNCSFSNHKILVISIVTMHCKIISYIRINNPKLDHVIVMWHILIKLRWKLDFFLQFFNWWSTDITWYSVFKQTISDKSMKSSGIDRVNIYENSWAYLFKVWKKGYSTWSKVTT